MGTQIVGKFSCPCPKVTFASQLEDTFWTECDHWFIALDKQQGPQRTACAKSLKRRWRILSAIRLNGPTVVLTGMNCERSCSSGGVCGWRRPSERPGRPNFRSSRSARAS